MEICSTHWFVCLCVASVRFCLFLSQDNRHRQANRHTIYSAEFSDRFNSEKRNSSKVFFLSHFAMDFYRSLLLLLLLSSTLSSSPKNAYTHFEYGIIILQKRNFKDMRSLRQSPLTEYWYRQFWYLVLVLLLMVAVMMMIVLHIVKWIPEISSNGINIKRKM